jgi:4-amino-4-deoxy-L-arabinose transferase-like glycosyltransferase
MLQDEMRNRPATSRPWTPAVATLQGLGRVRAGSVAGQPALWWWATALTIVGLAVRLVGLTARPVWADETYVVYWANRPWPAIPAALLAHEFHPPLFYLLLHLWLPLTGSDLLLRLPSALAGALVIPVACALGRGLVNQPVGLLAGLLVALSPVQVWFSQEARPYALLTLLFGLVLLALLRLQARPGWPAAAGYGLAAAAALYTHYSALLLFGGLTLAAGLLSVSTAARAWRRYWLAGTVAAAAAFAPWALAVLLGDHIGTSYTVSYRVVPPGLAELRKLLLDMTALGTPFWRLPGGRPEWLLAALLPLLGLGAWRLPGRSRTLLLGWLAGSLGLAGLVGQRYPVFFQTKVLVPLALALALLTAAGVAWLWSRRAVLGLAAIALVLGLNGQGLYRISVGAPGGLWVEDWRRAAALIAAEARPDDLVLLVPNGWVLPFQRASAGRGDLPAVRGLPVDLDQSSGLIDPPLSAEHLAPLAAVAARHPRIWLITLPADQAPHLNTALALDLLAATGVQEERIELQGIVIYRFARR